VTDYDGHRFGCGWVTEHMFMNSKRGNKMVQESRVKTQLRRYSNVLYHLIVSDTTGMSQLKIPRGEFLVLDNDELCDET